MPGTDGKAGFTLIEMMAVMMIVAMVAALVVAMVPGTGRAGLKAVVMNSVALLRRERLGAILSGEERHVALDSERRILVGDGGDRVIIPGDVAVEVLGADRLWAQGLAVASFHPDGGSSGGVLRLSRQGVEYEVRVNWYTGSVSIEAH